MAGHIAATTREQKENGGSYSASFPFIIQSETPAPRMVPPKAKVGSPPPFLVNLIKIITHWHAQRLTSSE